jgi:hypothetical protein
VVNDRGEEDEGDLKEGKTEANVNSFTIRGLGE